MATKKRVKEVSIEDYQEPVQPIIEESEVTPEPNIDTIEEVSEVPEQEPSADTVNSTDDNIVDPVDEPKDVEKEYNLFDSNGIIQMLLDKADDNLIQKEITRHLTILKEKFHFKDYFILFLFDEFTSLSSYESDKIYQSISTYNNGDILLILNNLGGHIEPAYLISQTCKKTTSKKFLVCVPRKAKSASTLLALGADEIHMGMMSEIGPIDPQIGGLPALGLGNSLEYIAKIVTKFPSSSTMFSQYLSSKLELNVLGYFERVSESATQYAERLIGNKELPQGETAKTIAEKLVYLYKDHSFVIDLEEAKKLLGEKIIKEDTNEYRFANEIYLFFDMLSRLIRIVYKKRFTYVGNINKGLNLLKDSK